MLQALDLYRDSLNLWSESHGHKSRSELGFNIELFAENANLLIAKTNLIIHDESENENESKVPSHPDEKITPTYDFASDFIVLTSNDPQALVTSLQMAESHNALGVEALENSAEGAGGRKTAIRHHIAAFNLIVKAEHLKASHNMKSISRVGKRVIGLLKETK